MKRKLMAMVISCVLVVSLCSCGSKNISKSDNQTSVTADSKEESESSSTTNKTEEGKEYIIPSKYEDMSVEEIVASLTLDQKAAQMVQGAVYNIGANDMKQYDYGSILSVAQQNLTYKQWQKIVLDYQEAAITSESGVPFIYGNDDVHGVNFCANAVIFPHNIGIGAANDPELTYQMGLATGDEAKLCYMLWNFSPCVAQATDPRWGRTYESYSTDLSIIKSLSTSYAKGLVDSGMVACGKHFFADGNITYGTGEDSDVDRLLDRGDSKLSEAEIQELLLVYQSLVDAGVQTIMISHSSLNGVKMHENAQDIQYLKNNMGFQGFIVSDWNSIHNISVTTLKEQVEVSINAGIDMLMEDGDYEECRQYIVEAVGEGTISMDRVNDAVSRIIKVKKDLGLFEDPTLQAMETTQNEVGSDQYRELATKLVEESQVLLKNKNNILPLAQGTKVYVTGPAADNVGIQCGGWTRTWSGSYEKETSGNRFIIGATSLLEGLQAVAKEKGITIITEKKEAANADVTLLIVGEQTYAEWNGDTEDLSLTGKLGLPGNKEAIEEAKELGLPTVTCIVAGRNVIISDYYDDWDGVVMCYLPGSEGEGVANVLCGKAQFSGKLPMPWYSSVNQIGTKDCFLETGYGLEYGK